MIDHDRTVRFIRSEMGWRRPPGPAALLELASHFNVTVTIPPAAGRRQRSLLALAVANVVGRLPVGTIRLEIAEGLLDLQVPPYRGVTVHDALGDLSTRLGFQVVIASPDRHGTAGLRIVCPIGKTAWGVGLDGSAAYLGRASQRIGAAYDPVGPYALACMIGGELLRGIGRYAAAVGAGIPGPAFESRTAPAIDRWLDFQITPPAQGSSASLKSEPIDIDWVSCGAVNQGILAVLAAYEDIEMVGTIYDPGILDAPDLNRSLLSFPDGIGDAKSHIGATSIGRGLRGVKGKYPQEMDGKRASWIVCGTDDPSVRPRCQVLRPERLVVTATENLFGYVGWHGSDTPDAFCGACQPAPPLLEAELIPTSAPTSVITAVAAASVIRGLLRRERPAHRLDLLTLRLDSELAVERSNPPPSPLCDLCAAASPS